MSLHAIYINRREAGGLAGLLKDAGYSSVSIARCHDYAINVIKFFAGADPGYCREVASLIRQACGFDAE